MPGIGAQGRGPQGRAGGQDGQMMRPPSRGRPGELEPGEEASGRFDSPEEDPLVQGRPQRRVCAVTTLNGQRPPQLRWSVAHTPHSHFTRPPHDTSCQSPERTMSLITKGTSCDER